MAALAASMLSLRKPLVDLALLRVGRTWRRSWLQHYERDVTHGSHFVVFLSRECPYCKRWVPLLNVIEVQPDLPSVVAVMSLEGDELHGFLQEHLITFPVTHMPQSLVSLMVKAYPTAALIENGRVSQKWIGEMPKYYMDRIRGFFETITRSRAASRRLRRVIRLVGDPPGASHGDRRPRRRPQVPRDASDAPCARAGAARAALHAAVFRMGDVVFQPTNPDRALFVVYAGRARLIEEKPDAEPVTLAVLAKGDTFGEHTLQSGSRRIHRARRERSRRAAPR